jgi:hypothetical protein
VHLSGSSRINWLGRDTAMVFVVRSPNHEVSRLRLVTMSPWGGLAWWPLVGSRLFAFFAALELFGDLGSYRGLSCCSRRWRSLLSVSMTLSRHYTDDVPDRVCRGCTLLRPVSRLPFPRRAHRQCFHCEGTVCELCVAAVVRGTDAMHRWVCYGCNEEHGANVATVPTLRQWVLTTVDARLHAVDQDHDFSFYFRLHFLSGAPLVNEGGNVVSPRHTRWAERLNRVWDSIYSATGGRVVAAVLGGRGSLLRDRCLEVEAELWPLPGVRWFDVISRAEARLCRDLKTGSPLEVTVVLGPWP